MESYQAFAAYYDLLTQNIDYARRGAYFQSLLNKYAPQATEVLDLACGTGSLTFVLDSLGYDMIGVDGSAEMLMQAVQKQTKEDILFLQQPMENLTLHGPVDAVVCALDSINHLADKAAVLQTFQSVSKHLEPGGLFLFDVNTLYKHEEILAETAFVYDFPQVYCVWQNEYQPDTHKVHISLDFFQPLENETAYQRQMESFTEQYYSNETLQELLKQAGLSVLHVFHEDSFEAPKKDSERIIYVTHKQ